MAKQKPAKPEEKKEEKPDLSDKVIEEMNKRAEEAKEHHEERKTWWSKKTPGQKGSFIASCCIFVTVIGAIFLWIYSRQLFGDAAGDNLLGYYLAEDGETKIYYHDGWEKIGHYFVTASQSWVTTLLIIAFGLFVLFITNFLVNLFTLKGKKARTVGSLIKSLMRYIVIILMIAFILGAWGVNVTSILAGVGIITLIVGLGAQTLVQDVIAGLFIVFDDFYDVGDTVIIDGFRGDVKEIGLKSTKLIDFGGNIKSINNSTITTVTNLTRARSVASVTMDVGYNEPVEHVEAIIAAELPKIKEKIPAIMEGPTYKGIAGFDQSGVQYLFIATCKEGDRFSVTRDMNREIYLMLVHAGVTIPFNQITVNQADPVRPAPSEGDVKVATRMTEINRAIPKPTKEKKSFYEKTKEAFLKSTEGDGD